MYTGRQIDEWHAGQIRDAPEQMKQRFQTVFSILTDLVMVSLDNAAAKVGSEADSLHEKDKPHKKQKAQHRRLEAKQWAITRTYIDPILRYFPTDVAVQQDKQEQLSAYLHDVEDAVHAFLLWLWVCYQDIEAHAHHDQITPAKTALRVLRRHKGKQGTDEVPLPQLQSRVNRQLDVGLSPHELLEVLEEMAMTNDDYSIRAWKANEDPENVRPKNAPFIEDITVELCYDEDYSPTYIGFLANHAEPDPAQ